MGRLKKDRLEITELFVAKASLDRCYFGIIKRFEDHVGNPQVFSKIVMPDNGYIVAQASDQKVLAKNLNCMARMIVFEGLHDDSGKTEEIFGTDLFLN